MTSCLLLLEVLPKQGVPFKESFAPRAADSLLQGLFPIENGGKNKMAEFLPLIVYVFTLSLHFESLASS